MESFTLEISPAPPSGIAQKTNVTGNSLVWEGLENGVNYQVRVRAHNRAPDPSSWSTWSTGMVPAAPPSAAGAPVTTELAPVGSQAQMRVNWAHPANNGDAISAYELQVRRGSSVVQTLTPAASATSQAVVVDTSETAYTYRIRARNKAGWGDWSPLSAERRGVIAPGARARRRSPTWATVRSRSTTRCPPTTAMALVRTRSPTSTSSTGATGRACLRATGSPGSPTARTTPCASARSRPSAARPTREPSRAPRPRRRLTARRHTRCDGDEPGHLGARGLDGTESERASDRPGSDPNLPDLGQLVQRRLDQCRQQRFAERRQRLPATMAH
ncbi:fibronectin type III domain-containing protein [Microbacterium sp. NIBRBAC000506063]|uniref:fibronectin type III domain-containing protein n=1 Tax=Microbacterium sp. NIBRBAC000506063 TaxID=2734618 RepID=UPI001CB742BC|nr:fibronectin type III domain-containing protein [Microbacterium sp. NIBRBAC000506063]